MTRYLLGELPAEDQTAFEKAYFDNPHVFAEVCETEHALIDDYVRGRLSSELRGRFEQVYLTDPRRRERVRFAQVLVARADESRAAARARAWLPTLALAAAVVVAVAAGLMWYVTKVPRPPQDSTQADTTPAAPAAPAPVAPAPSPPIAPVAPVAPPTPAPTLALVLAPGARTAAPSTPPTLIIPAGNDEVRLALTIREPESQRLRVIVRAIAGDEIVRRDFTLRTGATGTALTLTVPARAFSSGDYMLTLQGAQQGGTFEDLTQTIFRVETPAR